VVGKGAPSRDHQRWGGISIDTGPGTIDPFISTGSQLFPHGGTRFAAFISPGANPPASMRASLILLVIILLAIPAAGLQIVEFCPDPYLKGEGDAYVVVAGSGSLGRDHPGGRRGCPAFPPGNPDQRAYDVAVEGPAFLSTYGVLPISKILNASPRSLICVARGVFAMANRADQLVLKLGNRVLQEVRWPEGRGCPGGQIHYLENGTWDPRPRSRASPYCPGCISRRHCHSLRLPGRRPRGAPGSHPECLAGDPVSAYELETQVLPGSWPEQDSGESGLRYSSRGGPAGGSHRTGRGAALLMNRSRIPVYRMATTDAAMRATGSPMPRWWCWMVPA